MRRCMTRNLMKFQFLLLFLMSVLISQQQHLYTGAACFYWVKDATSSIFLLIEKCHRHLSTGGIFLLLQHDKLSRLYFTMHFIKLTQDNTLYLCLKEKQLPNQCKLLTIKFYKTHTQVLVT